jgi:hypothetical protein
MNDRELMQQALDALEFFKELSLSMDEIERAEEAITALSERLAQPEQASVGEVNRYGLDSHGRKWHGIHWYDPNVDVPHGTKLYTTPPAAQQEPDYWLGYGLQAHTEKPFEGATPVWTSPPAAQRAQPEKEPVDKLPSGFVPLQKENGRIVYAACMDSNAMHYKWLMWRHPDGQWVSKRKLQEWEVMQVEDQEHYGIVQTKENT